MTQAQLEIQLIAAVVAIACAIPGVFLVLRRKAMISDAISHSVLPGIVIVFFVVHDLSSPFLLLGAAVTGVVTVALTELVERTKLLKEDASIGLVFPILFSIGVIMITRNAENVHLDIDAVLLGELAFAPFNRMEIFGMDAGPKALYTMGIILLINLVFVILFFKELKITTFDPGLAGTLGFSPAVVQYSLMALVSLTVVGAFDAVGSILVVALMVAIPAAAYLLTDDLKKMLAISVFLGLVTAAGGYWTANRLDASIAGSMAVFAGLLFAAAFCFSPRHGLIMHIWRKRTRKKEFALMTLAIHLLNHEGQKEFKHESSLDHMRKEFAWTQSHIDMVIKIAAKRNVIIKKDDGVNLTEKGRLYAREALKSV